MKIFVSIPYTHEYESVVEDRVQRNAKYTLELIMAGHCVFSPIALGQNILDNTEYVDGTWDAWSGLCKQYIELCDEVHVIKCEGWDKSIGVQAEILHALTHDKDIVYIEV